MPGQLPPDFPPDHLLFAPPAPAAGAYSQPPHLRRPDPRPQLHPLLVLSPPADAPYSGGSAQTPSTLASALSVGSSSALATSPDGVSPAQHGLSSPENAAGRSAHESESDATAQASEAAQQRKKKKKAKDAIKLSEDQPLTTQGKERQRVYLACVQCRNRKIRCDGDKPICFNCSKRGVTECSYDSNPKRRGPDRQPGARQRQGKSADGSDGNEDVAPQARKRRRRRDTAPYQNPGPAITRPVAAPTELGGEQLDAAQLAALSSPLIDEMINSYADSKTFADVDETLSLVDVQLFAGIPILDEPTAVTNYDESDPAFTPYVGDVYAAAYMAGAVPLAEEAQEALYEIFAEPSMDFTRQTWWDALLAFYHAPAHPAPQQLPPLTLAQRDATLRTIAGDLRFLFETSNYWFSFFHLPRFFGNFFDPARRARMQPCLILGACALAVFLQSSEVGRGAEGRRMAMRLCDEARGALQASLAAGWIDDGLAQGAWLLAMFEVCAHPMHTTQRSRSAMVMLDSIIGFLRLTALDEHEPGVTRFSSFATITCPVVPPAPAPAPPQLRAAEYLSAPPMSLAPRPPASPAPYARLQNAPGHAPSYAPPALSGPARLHAPVPAPAPAPAARTEKGCECVSLTLGANWAPAQQHTPLWVATAMWDAGWSEAEVRKEECRRLCWSTLALAAGHASVSSSSTSAGGGIDLTVTDPSNFALFFNGEALACSPAYGKAALAKETVWALYNRVMLIWHSCLRMRADPLLTHPEKAQFAVAAWVELDNIEDALNRHVCDMERSFVYQGREVLFNTRMVISYEYQKYIPLAMTNFDGFFHRAKAEEWLRRQGAIVKGVMQGFHNITGMRLSKLTYRPFLVFWFMAQVSRALMLWQVDNSLALALDVAILTLRPIDHLTALWPCPTQRVRLENLRRMLENACYVAGRPPPPPFRDMADDSI